MNTSLNDCVVLNLANLLQLELMSTDLHLSTAHRTAIAAVGSLMELGSVSTMTDSGPTSGTMTPDDLSLSIHDVPTTLTSSNEWPKSPTKMSNGNLCLMTPLNPVCDTRDAFATSPPPLPRRRDCSRLTMELDAPALPAITSIGMNEQAIVQTLNELPKLFVVEQPSDKSPSIFHGNIYFTPVESKHIPEFCLAGETRLKLQLCVGFADPRVPARVVQRMNSLMTEKENMPTSRAVNTSGGMDTMEYPM